MIDEGSTFNIVYSKELNSTDANESKMFQVVARVSSGIRDIIKMNNDRIYILV